MFRAVAVGGGQDRILELGVVGEGWIGCKGREDAQGADEERGVDGRHGEAARSKSIAIDSRGQEAEYVTKYVDCYVQYLLIESTADEIHGYIYSIDFEFKIIIHSHQPKRRKSGGGSAIHTVRNQRKHLEGAGRIEHN